MSLFIDRRGSGALQYDGVEAKFGVVYPDMLSMWIADMDIAIPKPVQDAVCAFISGNQAGYQHVSVANSICEWLGAQQVVIDESWVVPCAGIVDALYHCVDCFTGRGDKVTVVSPTYSPLYDAVSAQGRALSVVSMTLNSQEAWSLDVTTIDPDSTAVLLCNPQNPTGHVWSYDQLQTLVDYCHSHNIIIICDEAHADFTFDAPFISLLNTDAQNWPGLIVLRSASKTFNLAAVDNAAYAIVPSPEQRNTFQHIVNQRHLSPSPLGCHILNTVYQSCDEWFATVKQVITDNRDLLNTHIPRLPDSLSVTIGAGTYFALLDARSLSADPAHTLLHDYHLALGPGDTEFLPGFFRLNLATHPQTIVSLVNRLCKNSKK
ncbi:aminotransferase class I/II-fold pyridoxal phosphate-dependent enzyme [Salinimonas chungwhensis]|uniref:aminotransferase class I/II-fold pyridoxal phosphate-dependent enzyme n=1 Tax=Salinimonas chungwhensis TaxID=265425 RepID=UPI000361295B|nr:aminotransferase class I/II-fold pyridoxal phosphate-dependent enzyme [Salinimonas chungwhensis]